jgi:hypothetical protein
MIDGPLPGKSRSRTLGFVIDPPSGDDLSGST